MWSHVILSGALRSTNLKFVLVQMHFLQQILPSRMLICVVISLLICV
jgi:hypothetical protein